MKKCVGTFFAFLAMFAANPVASQSYPPSPAKITRVALDAAGSAFLMISVNRPYPTQPACATDPNWHFAFDAKNAAGQALLTFAITAKNTQIDVRIVGLGTCTIHSTIETINVIDLL